MKDESLVKPNLVASASVEVNAPIDDVWNALITPSAIRKYMFDAAVTTSWREGEPIVWKGQWNGKPFEDKGIVLQVQPPLLLKYSHFSPKGEEEPFNYHIVTIELKAAGEQTRVSLTQDNNPTDTARQHSEKNWQTMLNGLKRVVES
jgi:uncharacterized protein YndB with AHSA1/START domain